MLPGLIRWFSRARGCSRGARVGLGACAALALVAFGVGEVALTAHAAPDRFAEHPAAEARLRAAARRAKVPFPLTHVALLLHKAERKLVLLSNGREVQSYLVGLGGSPAGHKQREGDSRTPEGDYYLCTKNDKSRFHLFLGISYPGPADARAGLADGRIDQATAERIAAVEAPKAPPWKTALGGEVGIHGGGGKRAGDWTLGCVAVENAEVDEIWIACPTGTPIRILP